MTFHRLDLVCHGIESLAGMKDLADRNFVVVNLQGNHLSDFSGFGTHSYMSQLNVRGNDITSFYGLTRQRSLQALEMKGNPVTSHPLYRVMALMVVGFSIAEIDGVPVSPEERTLARRAGTDAAMAVSFGWLLDMRPRTTEAFKSIIAECKHVHNRRAPKTTDGRRWKTVVDALREVEVGERAVESTPAVRDQLRAQAEEAIESKRTIARLSKRVATLEQMLREASAGTAATNTAVLLSQTYHDPLLLEYSGRAAVEHSTTLSDQELRGASSVVFADGISTRHNQGSQGQPPRRSCLQMSRRSVTVLNYMTRSPTFELKLSGSVSVRYRRPKVLIIENRFGVGLEVVFEDFDVLRTVFKLVFLLRSKPVPALPSWCDGADDSDEQWNRLKRSEAGTSETSESEADEDAATMPPLRNAAPPSSLSAYRAAPVSRLHAESSPASPAHAQPAPAVSPLASVGASVDPVVEEDNIPDVPPLPSPGEGSFNFRVEAPGSALPACERQSAKSNGAGSGSCSRPSVRVAVSPNDGSEIEFELEGGGDAPAGGTVPAVPGVLSQRFKNLLVSSSSDNGEDGSNGGAGEAAAAVANSAAVEAAAPRAPAPSLPPVVPKRRDSAAASVSAAPPSAPPSAMTRKGPPPVPPRLMPAGNTAAFTASRQSALAVPATLASSASRAKDAAPATPLSAAAARSARATPAATPLPSARNSVAAPPSVRGDGSRVGSDPASVASEAASLDAARPAAGGRFASLMVDSDSDSDT